MSDHDDLGTEADMEFNSAASSADPAQRAQIKTFCSVTGADADSALHVLEAHNWDMDRSVMFFLEGGASAPRQNQPAPAAPAAPRASFHSAQEPIDLDDEAPVPAQPQPAHATGFAPPSEHEVRHNLKLPVIAAASAQLPFLTYMSTFTALGDGRR